MQTNSYVYVYVILIVEMINMMSYLLYFKNETLNCYKSNAITKLQINSKYCFYKMN